MDTSNQRCNQPPQGWRCTRDAGHEGPCAAAPVADGPTNARLAELIEGQEVSIIFHDRMGDPRDGLARRNTDDLIAALRELQHRRAHETAAEPKQDGESIWLLAFADQEAQPPLAFSGAGADAAARRKFERASDMWTCRLFRCVAQSGYGPPTPTTTDAMIEAEELIRRFYTETAGPEHFARAKAWLDPCIAATTGSDL